MCKLLVRSCSHTNCIMWKVPTVNGCSAASAAVFRLSVTNHSQVFEGVCVGQLRANIAERSRL